MGIQTNNGLTLMSQNEQMELQTLAQTNRNILYVCTLYPLKCVGNSNLYH